MDLSKLDDIEPILLPEEHLILQRDDLYPTFWDNSLNNFAYLLELELTIDFESIKHDLYNCRFLCNADFLFAYDDKFMLLTVLYLAEYTKVIKSKIVNGKLKLNIFPEILDCFYRVYSECASTSLLYNKKCCIEAKRGKFVDCDEEVEIDYFCNLERIEIATSCVISGTVLGIFIWVDSSIIIDELPEIQIGDYCISPNRIKKINAFGNHGFYVQLNLLTFKQIFSLGKYDETLIGNIRDKLISFSDGYKTRPIEILNYNKKNYIIDQIIL